MVCSVSTFAPRVAAVASPKPTAASVATSNFLEDIVPSPGLQRASLPVVGEINVGEGRTEHAEAGTPRQTADPALQQVGATPTLRRASSNAQPRRGLDAIQILSIEAFPWRWPPRVRGTRCAHDISR